MGRLVSVVLVTWNSATWLRRCLDCVARQTYGDLELIVVDNASSDESVAIVTNHATRLIRNDTNRGFSAAVNQAIAVAGGDFVQLVNPDAFLEPDYVEQLVKAFDGAAPQFAMATGRLLRVDGDAIDSMGIRMTRAGRHLDITGNRRLIADNFEVFGVSGAAAMYKTAFLRDVAVDGEIFDEDFFAYREDADLSWRGRLFGWRAMYVPEALAYHVRRVTPEMRGQLPPEINMHSVKNRFLLRLKNEGPYLALRNAPFELARDLVVLGAALTIEWSSLPAFGWLWRNRRRVLAKRRSIQSRRRVSDRDLLRWFR
jgi:GT2 family glycosyltransferase